MIEYFDISSWAKQYRNSFDQEERIALEQYFTKIFPEEEILLYDGMTAESCEFAGTDRCIELGKLSLLEGYYAVTIEGEYRGQYSFVIQSNDGSEETLEIKQNVMRVNRNIKGEPIVIELTSGLGTIDSVRLNTVLPIYY